MIDRDWEQWAKQEVPRVEMWAHDYDPNCRGCRTEYHTEREYMSMHSCTNPDKSRPFVPQPFEPRFTVVPGTSLSVRILTLPQLPPSPWDLEREAKRTRNPFVNPPVQSRKPARSKKADSR